MIIEDFLVKVFEEGLEDRFEFLFFDENERKEKCLVYDDWLWIELEVIN